MRLADNKSHFSFTFLGPRYHPPEAPCRGCDDNLFRRVVFDFFLQYGDFPL